MFDTLTTDDAKETAVHAVWPFLRTRDKAHALVRIFRLTPVEIAAAAAELAEQRRGTGRTPNAHRDRRTRGKRRFDF